MNKKMNLFAILPLFGSIIVLLWLFVKVIKKEINKKRFYLYFFSCGLVGGISIWLLRIFVLFLNNQLNFSDELFSVATIIAEILGGYLMNLFTFLLLNKKCKDLKFGF